MDRILGARGIIAIVLVLLMMTLAGVIANTLMLFKISSTVAQATPRSLPCAAIPTKLILEDPICAQKLLETMNVTNVRIANGATFGQQDGNTATVLASELTVE